MTNVVREYEHRTFGAIGKVELSIVGDEWKLNGAKLPASSIEHLMTFALQTLQDAYAGAKTRSEAQAALDKKLDKILAGTIGTRAAGDGTSAETALWRKVAKMVLKVRAPEKFKEMKDDDAKLDAFVEKNRAKLQPLYDEEVATAKRRREAMAIEL